MSYVQPVIFIGHGSPMNIVNQNDFTKSIQNLGKQLIRPSAILVISAHWLTKGSYLTYTDDYLKTIYDFGGFPKELYEKKYSPRGSKKVSELIQKNLAPNILHFDSERGLDHGSWGVLIHLFPDASIPVIELSVDFSQSMEQDYELAKSLGKLREENILIVVSGNIIHNFEELDFDEKARPRDWAIDFQNSFKEKLQERKTLELLQYTKLKNWEKAINSADHYYPLAYALGVLRESDEIETVFEGIQNGSISMFSFMFGDRFSLAK